MNSSSNSSQTDLSQSSYQHEVLRREISQTTKEFALCYVTFVSKTYIEEFIYERVIIPKINVSDSSSDNSHSSSDELSSQINHKMLEERVSAIVYSRTNSSTSSPLAPGISLEPGDYTIGVIFKNESDVKELYALQLKIKYKTISNFNISQILTQFIRAFGYSPSQLLHLPQKSDGEFTPVITKIRNDISSLSKLVKSTPIPTTNSVVTVAPAAIPITSLSTSEIIDPKILLELRSIKERLTGIDEKCVETNYLTKKSSSNKDINDLFELQSMLKLQLHSVETKIDALQTVSVTSKNEVVYTLPDLSKLIKENRILTEKLLEAENHIESIEMNEETITSD